MPRDREVGWKWASALGTGPPLSKSSIPDRGRTRRSRRGCSSRLSPASRKALDWGWRLPSRSSKLTAARSAGNGAVTQRVFGLRCRRRRRLRLSVRRRTPQSGPLSANAKPQAAARECIVSQILIVDDEEAVCWALKKALSAEGHRVAVAASAEEAFVQAEKQTPDAIILDVRLPGLDGLSALGKLRALSDDAPVIVVTAFGNLSTAVRAVEGGAFDYLAKPFDLQQALETEARALQRQIGRGR